MLWRVAVLLQRSDSSTSPPAPIGKLMRQPSGLADGKTVWFVGLSTSKVFFFFFFHGHFCRFVHKNKFGKCYSKAGALDAFQHQDIVRVYLQRPRLCFYHCLRPAWILFVISWQWRSKDLTDNASTAASPPWNRFWPCDVSTLGLNFNPIKLFVSYLPCELLRPLSYQHGWIEEPVFDESLSTLRECILTT